MCARFNLLQGLADGMTLGDLAERTGRSERSLRRNLRTVWDLLEVEGLAQGLVRAARLGLVE